MFKKLFTFFFVVVFCSLVIAQQSSAERYSGTETGNYNNDGINAMWDVLLNFDVSTISGASGNAGAEWDGTSFYTTRWASNLIHEYSADGTTLIREFSIPGVSGLRDLAYDGQYFYGGAASTTIYMMDFSTNTLIGTITSPVAVRHIAYDSDNDAFWVGNWDTDIYLVSRTGVTLATIPAATHGFTAMYGSCYDNVSAGGPYLWIFDQGPLSAGPQAIHQLQLPSGTPTGVIHDVLSDVGTSNPTAISGGLFCMTDYESGFFTIGGLLQGVPDQFFVYEVEQTGGGGTVIFSDNFDSYISGEQLACQNPTDWTTWSNLPCDATEDAYISSNYAHSGANSFVVVPNNDEVHAWGPVTSGKWEIDLYNYLPTGATGYFNQLGQFTAVQEWGLEVYFNAGGAASINAGGTGSGAFTFVYDTWVLNQVIVDLDNDQAEYWYNGSMVFGPWQWTAGSNGTPIALSLEANDFFGAAATDEMYVDDYKVIDLSGITPVELTSFAANVNNNGQVVLNWATASETNNQMFEIQRTTENSEFVTIGFVNGAGTTTEQQQYSYTDRTVDPGTYSYRLKQIDFDGRFDYSNVVDVDVKGPLTFELKQNYPNPFNPTTNIKYNIPVASNVKLAVYNVVGEEVAVLVNGFVQEGFYEVTFNASSLPSGVYFYKLQSGNLVQTNKMMLLK